MNLIRKSLGICMLSTLLLLIRQPNEKNLIPIIIFSSIFIFIFLLTFHRKIVQESQKKYAGKIKIVGLFVIAIYIVSNLCLVFYHKEGHRYRLGGLHFSDNIINKEDQPEFVTKSELLSKYPGHRDYIWKCIDGLDVYFNFLSVLTQFSFVLLFITSNAYIKETKVGMPKDFANTQRRLIQEDRLEEVFNNFKIYKGLDEYLDEVTILKNRYARLNRSISSGTISDSEMNSEKNKIIRNVLTLLTNIQAA